MGAGETHPPLTPLLEIPYLVNSPRLGVPGRAASSGA